MARAYRVISSDGHLELPPEQWVHRVAPAFRDRAPRRIKTHKGGDAVISEGRALLYGGTKLFGGHDVRTYDPTIMEYEKTPGCGAPEGRLAMQDTDGLDAEILYSLGIRNTGIKDRNVFLALIQGYNDYLAEEYCAVDRDRLIAACILPGLGADEDVREMERCARKGLKVVQMGAFPNGGRFPAPEDDRFWAAALDLQMAVVIHTSFSTSWRGREVPLLRYPVEPQGEDRPPIDFIERLARYGNNHCGLLEAVQLVFSGVFDRFPRLRIFWAENGIGWLPYAYEQMDRSYEECRHWAQRFLGVAPLERKPSEYLREHAYWGFFEDHHGIGVRHLIGVDRIMWSTDFPHEVTRYPHSVEFLRAQLQGVPQDEQWQIMAGNAIEFFHLDHVAPAVSAAKVQEPLPA